MTTDAAAVLDAQHEIVDERDKVRAGEKVGYGAGVLSSVVMNATIGSFLLVFYTDVFGISPAAAGTLFLIARAVDGINDPVMGYLVDHLPRFRLGRLRPVALLGIIIAAVNFALLFASPNLTLAGKLIWAYVTYLLFGFTYDLVSIPSRALLPVMAPRTHDRNSLASISGIVGIVGYAAIAGATVYLVRVFGDPQAGWRTTAMIYAAVAIVFVLIMVVAVKERVHPSTTKKYDLKNTPRIIFGNRPLLAMLGAFMFTSLSISILQPAALLYFTYNVGDARHYGGTTMASTLGMVVAIGVFPLIAKRIGRRKTYIMFSLIAAVGSLSILFLPVTAIGPIYAASILLAIGMAAPGALNNSMIADTTDYAEWQNGVRAEGAIYAGMSFVQKLVGGLAGAIPGYVLALTGYVPNVAQTPQALNGILILRTVLPAVFTIMAAILMGMNPLNEARYQQIIKEIRAKKAAQGADA